MVLTSAAGSPDETAASGSLARTAESSPIKTNLPWADFNFGLTDEQRAFQQTHPADRRNILQMMQAQQTPDFDTYRYIHRTQNILDHARKAEGRPSPYKRGPQPWTNPQDRTMIMPHVTAALEDDYTMRHRPIGLESDAIHRDDGNAGYFVQNPQGWGIDTRVPRLPDNPTPEQLNYWQHRVAAVQSWVAVAQAQGNPDMPTKIYRAVPHGIDKINPEDWVALSPMYAKLHAEAEQCPECGRNLQILRATVPAKHVRFDSASEYGFFGPEPVASEGRVMRKHPRPEPGWLSDDQAAAWDQRPDVIKRRSSHWWEYTSANTDDVPEESLGWNQDSDNMYSREGKNGETHFLTWLPERKMWGTEVVTPTGASIYGAGFGPEHASALEAHHTMENDFANYLGTRKNFIPGANGQKEETLEDFPEGTVILEPHDLGMNLSSEEPKSGYGEFESKPYGKGFMRLNAADGGWDWEEAPPGRGGPDDYPDDDDIAKTAAEEGDWGIGDWQDLGQMRDNNGKVYDVRFRTRSHGGMYEGQAVDPTVKHQEEEPDEEEESVNDPRMGDDHEAVVRWHRNGKITWRGAKVGHRGGYLSLLLKQHLADNVPDNVRAPYHSNDLTTGGRASLERYLADYGDPHGDIREALGIHSEEDEPDWSEYYQPMTREAAAEVQHQGDSPLDYSSVWRGDQPERLAVVDPDAGEAPKVDGYFNGLYNEPAAAPGTVAFLDYSRWRPDSAYVHYMATRSDQQKQGHQRRLVEGLLARHPEVSTVDFGEEMEPQVTHLRQSLQQAHPDKVFRGKVRHYGKSIVDSEWWKVTASSDDDISADLSFNVDPEWFEGLDAFQRQLRREQEEYRNSPHRGRGPVQVDFVPDPIHKLNSANPELAVQEFEGERGNRDHITRTEHGMVPIEWVRNLRGASGEVPGEHRNYQGQRWEDFKDALASSGEGGIHAPIFITVDWNGDPVISEGNHRLTGYGQIGATHVPIEARYFGHAEKQGTLGDRYNAMQRMGAKKTSMPRDDGFLRGLRYDISSHVQPGYPEDGFHKIKAWHPDGNDAGYLEWDAFDGRILDAAVAGESRRKGLGTELYNRAHQHSVDNGLAPPEHAWDDLSDDARGWITGMGQEPEKGDLGYEDFHRRAAVDVDFRQPEPAYNLDEDWDTNNQRRKAWRASIRHALSMGHVTPEQAQAVGYSGSGHDQGGRTGLKWQPLPSTLYHVTTDLPGVMQHGIKSRDELAQDRGKGLGGGESDTISYTDDPATAQRIHEALHEFHGVLNGKKSMREMYEEAKAGTGAQKPWDAMLRNVEFGSGAGDDDPGLQAVLEGRKYQWHGLPYSQAEMEEHFPGEGWEPHPTSTTWDSPRGTIYTSWHRPMTEDEKRDRTASFYKTWAAGRMHAGGPEDPMFFSTDLKGFAAMDPKNFGIVKASPHPGAQGYPVSALGEWRTTTGQNVDVDPQPFSLHREANAMWREANALATPYAEVLEKIVLRPKLAGSWGNHRYVLPEDYHSELDEDERQKQYLRDCDADPDDENAKHDSPWDNYSWTGYDPAWGDHGPHPGYSDEEAMNIIKRSGPFYHGSDVPPEEMGPEIDWRKGKANSSTGDSGYRNFFTNDANFAKRFYGRYIYQVEPTNWEDVEPDPYGGMMGTAGTGHPSLGHAAETAENHGHLSMQAYHPLRITGVEDTGPEEMRHRASANPDESGLKAAGIAVIAMDTGRVLMLQRALNPVTCPCGMPVAWDEQNGWQHEDGSVSHDNEFYGQSVSDLLDQGHHETCPECGGTGEDGDGHECTPCDGSGVDPDESLLKTADWADDPNLTSREILARFRQHPQVEKTAMPRDEDYLNNLSFEFTPNAPLWGGVDHEHQLGAYDYDGAEHGFLRWNPETGVVKNIDTVDNGVRQGLGTELLRRAKEISRKNGYPELRHSHILTEDGKELVRGLGDQRGGPVLQAEGAADDDPELAERYRQHWNNVIDYSDDAAMGLNPEDDWVHANAYGKKFLYRRGRDDGEHHFIMEPNEHTQYWYYFNTKGHPRRGFVRPDHAMDYGNFLVDDDDYELGQGRTLPPHEAALEFDKNEGVWEFPGGTLEDGENPRDAAVREFAEEVGQGLPPGVFVGSWLSPSGTEQPVYKGFIYLVQNERDIDLAGARNHINPDDPDGDMTEQCAWWDIEDAKNNPALRPECKTTPWDEFEVWADKSVRSNREVVAMVSKMAAQPPADAPHRRAIKTGPFIDTDGENNYVDYGGRRYYRKVNGGKFDMQDAKDAADKEYLGSLLRRSIGANAAHVIRSPRSDDPAHTVYSEVIPEKTNPRWTLNGGYSNAADETKGGILAGLGDMLQVEGDRRGNNWRELQNGEPYVFDFAYSDPARMDDLGPHQNRWGHVYSDFSHHYTKDHVLWSHALLGDNPLAPNTDVPRIEAALKSTRPEYERAGRGDWHDELMDRWNELKQHAAGDDDNPVLEGRVLPHESATTKLGMGLSHQDENSLAYLDRHGPGATYVRFGDWPRNERSMNHITGFPEEGVSVYEMDKEGQPLDPDSAMTRGWHEHSDSCGDIDEDGQGEYCGMGEGEHQDPEYFDDTYDMLRSHIADARKSYNTGHRAGKLVQGDLVGFGHDDEPLLKNVSQVGHWPCDVHKFIPGLPAKPPASWCEHPDHDEDLDEMQHEAMVKTTAAPNSAVYSRLRDLISAGRPEYSIRTSGEVPVDKHDRIMETPNFYESEEYNPEAGQVYAGRNRSNFTFLAPVRHSQTGETGWLRGGSGQDPAAWKYYPEEKFDRALRAAPAAADLAPGEKRPVGRPRVRPVGEPRKVYDQAPNRYTRQYAKGTPSSGDWVDQEHQLQQPQEGDVPLDEEGHQLDVDMTLPRTWEQLGHLRGFSDEEPEPDEDKPWSQRDWKGMPEPDFVKYPERHLPRSVASVDQQWWEFAD